MKNSKKIKNIAIISLSFLILLIIIATGVIYYQLNGLQNYLNDAKNINDSSNESQTNYNNNEDNNSNQVENKQNDNESITLIKNEDYTVNDNNPDDLLNNNDKVINFEINPTNLTSTSPENYINNLSYFNNNDPIESIPSISDTFFQNGINYSDLEGIISFRGNNFRNQTSFGYAEINEEKLEIIWEKPISYIDSWTGVGWTGQPLIVKWPDSTKNIMNLYNEKKLKNDLKEVIYATLDGNIYFLDLEDGSNTRDPLIVGYPFKGTVSLDPRGYPLLYAGQGIDKINDQRVPIGFRIFDLTNQEQIYFLDGQDQHIKRDWYAFDSSCLVDSQNDIVFEPGENGIFYKIYLNSHFDGENISIDPEIYKYRFEQNKNISRVGIENSMVAYDNYGYFADNAGIVQCIDLNTLESIWAIDLNEDIDASLVLDVIDENNVYIYCGTEVDFQGNLGYAGTYKINALTGEIIWENEYYCASTEAVNGGCLATPVVDDNIVYFNIAKIDGSNKSLIVALDKNNGDVIWQYKQNNYCWSSPALVETKLGDKYLIQCDSIGQVILFNALNGNIEDVIDLGTNIEGSPAIYNNTLVVGTRGQKIYGIKIK